MLIQWRSFLLLKASLLMRSRGGCPCHWAFRGVESLACDGTRNRVGGLRGDAQFVLMTIYCQQKRLQPVREVAQRSFIHHIIDCIFGSLQVSESHIVGSQPHLDGCCRFCRSWNRPFEGVWTHDASIFVPSWPNPFLTVATISLAGWWSRFEIILDVPGRNNLPPTR